MPGEPIAAVLDYPTTEIKPVTLKERFKTALDEDPQADTQQIHEATIKVLDMPEAELRGLPIEEYIEWLGFVHRSEVPELAQKNIGLIADRFVLDAKHASELQSFHKSELLHGIGQGTRNLLWDMARRQDITIEPSVIERFYNNIDNDIPYVRDQVIEYIGDLIILDKRNEKNGQELAHVFEKCNSDAIGRLAHPRNGTDISMGLKLLELSYDPIFDISKYNNLFLVALEQADSTEVAKKVFAGIANKIGIGKARQIIQQHARTKPEFEERFKQIEASLGIDKTDKAFADLRELYDKINFHEYKPNQELTEFESQLLLEQLTQSPILDIACGTGRLMSELRLQGRRVVGVDIVGKHVAKAKEVDPQAEVVLGSWSSLPFAEKSFKGAYCLGRSFLHNTTVEDGIDFLREAHRILDDDGVFVVDIPDPQEGQYALARKNFEEKMDRLGIDYFEEGFIHDSPDGKSFFDRLAPFPEQFQAMATLAGFQAEKITEKKYVDAEREESANIYWRLTKRKQFDYQAFQDVREKAYTTGIPLRLRWV